MQAGLLHLGSFVMFSSSTASTWLGAAVDASLVAIKVKSFGVEIRSIRARSYAAEMGNFRHFETRFVTA